MRNLIFIIGVFCVTEGGNLIISPITVWTVLAVIAEGATHNTLKEIGSAIRVNPKYKDKVKQEYQSLLHWLQVITPTIELQKFNALFVDDRNRPLKDFQDVAKDYDTRMISVNFTDSERTSQLVNTAINTVTHGRIPALVSSADLESANLLFSNISLDTVFDELKVAVEEYGDDEVDCFVPRFKIESSLSMIQTTK
ncbi:unnamed protein product, partial [Brenthis ino]